MNDNKSRNIEEIIISVLLNDPEQILTQHLESRWFTQHRRIIDAMQHLAATGVTVDAFSVSDRLGGDSNLGLVVDIQRNVFGSKHNYSNYVDQLRRIFEAKSIQAAIKKAHHDIGAGEKPSEVLSGLISESMKMASLDGKKFVYDAKESMNVFVDKLSEIFDARDTGGTGLKTGIAALDNSMGGIHPSDMTIVGARPGVGKTAFAVSVLRNVAKSGKKVGFFSTEMSVFQVMSRFTAMEANINAHKLRHADLDEMDFTRLTAATSVISQMGINICDKPAITIGELSMQARAWMADGGIDFIVVDYLTRLHPDKVGFNQNIDIGLIVTGLKNLARNLNIPIMVLAQLNRSGAARKDKRPIMSDLRDSGVIEQEADQVLMLYRPDEDNDNCPEVIIEKNRHGECGIVRCVFNPEIMEWSSFAD
ncbi:DnaB-like helicase C-terminal domain-containing protein [Methylobacter sp. G7]|uniref:replicative DNA helicase n=1 Tax=Methylobacter sp. G7 TaxID=3230117 RepID=UPI003D8062E0